MNNNTEEKLFPRKRLEGLAITALFSAVLCVISPLSIPLSGLVPISLATFGVYLTASLLDVKKAIAAVAVYIALGAAGLPVFSGFEGGIQKLVGVTGGFIVGYLPLAFIVSLVQMKSRKHFMTPVSMLIGTAVLYFIGTAWFVFQTGNPISSALASCVLPFLAGDAAKIVVASALSFALKTRIKKQS